MSQRNIQKEILKFTRIELLLFQMENEKTWAYEAGMRQNR